VKMFLLPTMASSLDRVSEFIEQVKGQSVKLKVTPNHLGVPGRDLVRGVDKLYP
jgi:hypothetical protein